MIELIIFLVAIVMNIVLAGKLIVKLLRKGKQNSSFNSVLWILVVVFLNLMFLDFGFVIQLLLVNMVASFILTNRYDLK